MNSDASGLGIATPKGPPEASRPDQHALSCHGVGAALQAGRQAQGMQQGVWGAPLGCRVPPQPLPASSRQRRRSRPAPARACSATRPAHSRQPRTQGSCPSLWAAAESSPTRRTTVQMLSAQDREMGEGRAMGKIEVWSWSALHSGMLPSENSRPLTFNHHMQHHRFQ